MIITIQYICDAWYIASIYITLSLLVLELIRLSQRIKPRFPKWMKGHWQQTRLTLFFLIVFGVTGLMIHAYHTIMNPIVKNMYIMLPKAAGDRNSLTTVMMGGLYIGEVIGKGLVQKYVRPDNEQHPGMVVLVGNVTDYESRFAEDAHIEEDLRQLKAPLGVYIIYGSCEYRANRNAKYHQLQKTEGTLLIDSVVRPDSTFYPIGRGDFISKRRRPLHSLTEGLDTKKSVIVLDHQPWSFTEMNMNGIDLELHGYTHNGQLWPYPLLMKLMCECPYGYYRKGSTQFYISSGIGIAGPPYRVGTAPELIILHIRFKAPKRTGKRGKSMIPIQGS